MLPSFESWDYVSFKEVLPMDEVSIKAFPSGEDTELKQWTPLKLWIGATPLQGGHLKKSLDMLWGTSPFYQNKAAVLNQIYFDPLIWGTEIEATQLSELDHSDLS